MFLPVSLSKSKLLTRVALVSFVSHSCSTRVARVSLLSLMLHSCCIFVSRVALVSLVSGTRVTRLDLQIRFVAFQQSS